MAQNAWKVWSKTGWKHNENGKIIVKHRETVFYNDDIGAEQVLRSLINHDGYPTDIVILNSSKPK